MRIIKIIITIVLFILFIQKAVAQSADQVIALPGYGKVKEIQYAGYSSATSKPCTSSKCLNHPELFYWFVSAQTPDAQHKPIILWSNGGPGSSSLYGFFLETGPYTINSDLTLKDQLYAWDQFANYLIIDHPLSVGLSFGNKKNYPENVAQGIDQYYYALLYFLKHHPPYQNNPIFLSGESYAGTYLPLLAIKILKENKIHPENKINLRGLIIISGWVDPLIQQSQDSDYAYYHGLINKTQKYKIDLLEQHCIKAILHHSNFANQICTQINDTIVKFSGINAANIALKEAPDDDDLKKYLDQTNVRIAIHAKSYGKFADFSDAVSLAYSKEEQNSCLNAYNQLLTQHVPILFFTGLNDEKDSNFLGARAWIKLLHWPKQSIYQTALTTQWRDKYTQELLGYRKEGGGFTWITVLNAGHMVPIDQPKINQLVQEFIKQPN